MQRLFKILLSVFLFFLLILGFSLPLTPPNGFWYQQFMPPLNGRAIIDIEFTDSLTGYAITSSDTPYVLKTTNGGDNWSINFTDTDDFSAFEFINSNTGFIARGFVSNSSDMLYKTTNGGANWYIITMPEQGIAMDISVLNKDTFWVADPTPLNIGGLYRTIDGGTSWLRTFAGGNNNPEHIYMFNARIGFMTLSQGLSLWKTTDGGFNWAAVSGGVWNDIYFIDSLTGWKCNPIKKTIDGGLNWVTQTLPNGGIIIASDINRFSVLNKDTIWGAGGQVFYGGGRFRGMLYRTTNGGNNWLFQVPDTSFGITSFQHIHFLNTNIGWAYGNGRGIHTTNGGDTTFLVGLKQISTEIPVEYKLYQNYPNPFNPKTTIKYQITNSKYQSKTMVKLIIYDLIGKEIIKLVNEEQKAGIYQVDFSGDGYSSGVYFYTLIVDDIRFDTKKMLLIK